MGVCLALVAKAGLSPSCPRTRASSPILPLSLDSRFRGNDEARPFQRPFLGALEESKLNYELVSKFISVRGAAFDIRISDFFLWRVGTINFFRSYSWSEFAQIILG